jgi:hypothetical protein
MLSTPVISEHIIYISSDYNICNQSSVKCVLSVSFNNHLTCSLFIFFFFLPCTYLFVFLWRIRLRNLMKQERSSQMLNPFRHLNFLETRTRREMLKLELLWQSFQYVSFLIVTCSNIFVNGHLCWYWMINPLLWDYIGLILSNHSLLIAETFINKQTTEFISKKLCHGHISSESKTPSLVSMGHSSFFCLS